MITDRMLESHVAIVGTTGGGKSYTARGLVERLVDAGRRVCVIDTMGNWWGLKANAAGDGPGLPMVVFGGDRADVPITRDSGDALGRIVAERDLACIVDTDGMGVNERTRFLTAFLGRLYTTNRRALWVVLEEADEIAPQGGSRYPDASRLLDAADRIVRRGRARGFRVVMISQRPAVIHKNILTQVHTLVAHRLTAPQDTGAVMDWIRANADTDAAKAVISALPRLATGEAWVWSPGNDVLDRGMMPPNRTFDSAKTPDADEAVVDPVGLAEVDAQELRSLLQAPASTAEAAAPDPDAIAAAERRGYDRGQQEALERIHTLEAAVKHYQDGLGAVMRAARGYLDESLVSEELRSAPQAPAGPPPVREPAPGPRPAQPPRVAGARGNSDAMPSSARKILTVLDTNPPVRYTWRQACSLAGLRPRGGHFNAGRKWLRESRMIVEEDETIRIAEPSADAAPLPADPAERARRMRENWQAMLGNPCDRILAEMAQGAWHTKASIAETLGLKATGGHWNNAWATLRRNNLIEEDADCVRLASWLRHGVATWESLSPAAGMAAT